MTDETMITLDPDDPFDAALIPIVLTNRRKRADYARISTLPCTPLFFMPSP